MSHSDVPQLLLRFRVTGMDCAHDAREIETAARTVPGLQDVKVSVASQILSMSTRDARVAEAVEQAVARIGYRLDRVTGAIERTADDGAASPTSATTASLAYRRALWVVIVLNAGYGVVEAIGGFLSGSQALKADALDFLGDGLISFLGLIALGWRPAIRARAALVQGVFLGALGIGVLGTTIYRIVQRLMGVFGLVALGVNVAAAVTLIPHRTGDANARAIWLFSRNDALGNVAVVIAAGLVAWTGSAWPDIVVALLIASLFMQSAWAIIRDARGDLAAAGDVERSQHAREQV
jgi:Co/Zn/Cd efflux system component/copper chaperone CopZ